MFLLTSSQRIILSYLILAATYISGLFIPLMESDSAQHATMAMRMYLENDFLNIYRGEEPYLDKPHLHFWLAALSFKLFGISENAYRIPSVLCLWAGGFAIYKLARLYYDNPSSHFAALIYLSAQTIILSAHDVRTDAVLTGMTALALWKLIEYLKKGNVLSLIFGAFFMAMAFSSKGLIAVVNIGFCLLGFVVYERAWKSVFNWKILIGIFAFTISISPVLLVYYTQFDSHPELEIAGQTHISGVKFILWDQSFNRLTGTGFEPTSPDYFFFFHTLLWAMLPFSILFYFALFGRIWKLISLKFKFIKGEEFFSLIGVSLTLLLISFSQFKLPHYLNSLIPVIGILCISYLIQLQRKPIKKIEKMLLWIQYFTFSVGTGITLILVFVFPIQNYSILLVGILLFLIFIYFLLKKESFSNYYVTTSVVFIACINFFLNTQFYPKLTEFQGGQQASKIIHENNIPLENVYILNDDYSWSLDFNTHRNTPKIRIEMLSSLPKNSWIYMEEGNFRKLNLKNKNNVYFEIDKFRITRLSLKFLNPGTRPETLEKIYLVKIN